MLYIKDTYEAHVAIRVVLDKVFECSQSSCNALWVGFTKIIALQKCIRP